MIDGLNLAAHAASVAAPPVAMLAVEAGFVGLLAAALPAVAQGAAPGMAQGTALPAPLAPIAAAGAAGVILPPWVPAWPAGLSLPIVPPDVASASDVAAPDAEAPVHAVPVGLSPADIALPGTALRRPLRAAELPLASPGTLARPVARLVSVANVDDNPPTAPLTGLVPVFDVLPVSILLMPLAGAAPGVAIASPMPPVTSAPSFMPLALAGDANRQLPASGVVTLGAGPAHDSLASFIPEVPASVALAVALPAVQAPPAPSVAAPVVPPGVQAPVAASPLPAGAATLPIVASAPRRELRARPGAEQLDAVAPRDPSAMPATMPHRANPPTVNVTTSDTEPARTADPVPAMTVATVALGDVRIGLDGGPSDLRVSLGLAPGGAAIVVADAARLAGDLAAGGVRLLSLDVGSGGANSGDARPRNTPAWPVAGRAFVANVADHAPVATDRYA